jgi:hypothetical protein
MSNSEPSVMVRQRIPCMRGIIHRFEWEKTIRSPSWVEAILVLTRGLWVCAAPPVLRILIYHAPSAHALG